ncbi:uncharacterized protein LOC110465006 [Mizuhopecten yessoensis]|uniref:MHD2 domain-containing protein n=1 Tax=Mizuhopecten yessoensis TaxID=6573 RepID=A0A210R1Y6_MIZYE|nr:uncharacterized protein LOC110465006 [Mizuhopecten yessoensis]OWF55100.1 hypothetical protein KP79_PYT17083 [Mizuhopecten yessoensis]
MATPRTPAPQLLKPRPVLQLIAESEERLWTRLDLSDSNEFNLHTPDTGSRLLRHGKTIKTIHRYFGDLEQRKCCLSLTGCKTKFNQVRLVRNDGRDSGIEEGAMMKTATDNSTRVNDLDDTELRVFRFAYVCASLPVLGAPEPPSALSPSPVFTPIDTNKKFTYSGRVRSPTPHDSGVDEQDDTSIVPAETLRELLMRAFRLVPEKFHQYEQRIAQNYGNKQAEKILAEELVGQLAALQKNSNPFYSPDSFMNTQGYDKWQRREFAHIADLMKKFWHLTYPPPSTSHIHSLRTIHDDYRALMERLIRYESPYRLEGELHAPGPTSPLSSASIRLLKEFGLRYGIRELYRKIVYLLYLSKNFDPTVWFMQHTCAVLTCLMDSIPKNDAQLVLVKKEHTLLVECVNALETQVITTLTKMKVLFPNNRPAEALESLIELMTVTLQAKSSLTRHRSDTLQSFLLKQVQKIFPTCYKEHKMVVVSDLGLTSPEQLSPVLLNRMIGQIRDEVKEYKLHYQSSFEKYFPIVREAAQSLYRLLMDDVTCLCQLKQKQFTTLEIDKSMLGLGYRLNQLDQDWSSYLTPEMETWREVFVKEELHWTVVIKVTLQHLVVRSVSLDQFRMEQYEDLQSCYSSSLSSFPSFDNRRRTISTKSITPSLNSAFSGLVSSAQSTPVHNKRTSLTSECGTHYPTIHESPLPLPGQPSVLSQEQQRARTEAVNIRKFSQMEDMRGLHSDFGLNKTDGDTKSLEDFVDEYGDAMVTFSYIRHSSSLPDILSKSYDHSLSVSRRHISQNLGDKDLPEIKPVSCDHNKNQSLIDKVLPDDSEGQSEKQKMSHDLVVSAEVHQQSFEDSELMKAKVSNHDDDKDIHQHLLEDDELMKAKVSNHDDDNDIHQQLLEDDELIKAKVGNHDDDKDSLAEEFHNDSDNTFTESDDDNLTDHTESADEDFAFPPIEIVSMVSEKLDTQAIMTPVPSTQKKDLIAASFKEMNGSTGPSRPTIVLDRHISCDSVEDSVTPANSVSSPISPSSPTPKVMSMLPLSSSVVDLIVMLQRLVEFSSTISQTFCHSTVKGQTSVNEDSILSLESCSDEFYLTTKMSDARQKLYDNIFEGLCNTLCVYADNMLCLDLCGTTVSVARRLVGPQLVSYLQTQQTGGLIWGCRHDTNRVKDCFMYVNKKAELLCDRYEPITKDMCTRINNMAAVSDYLDSYHGKLGKAFDVYNDWRLKHKSYTPTSDHNSYDKTEYEVVTGFSYNPESDRQFVMETASQITSTTTSSRSCHSVIVQSLTRPCHDHLMAVLRALSRIMAYRINLFVCDALHVLLGLKHPDDPIHVCLQPLTQFLQNYFDSLQAWLYPDCFRRVTECIWIFIVQDFEEELSRLMLGDGNGETNGRTLIQALSHLLTFITHQDKDIRKDLLLSQAEDVMFKLQLFTESTPQLMRLHNALKEHNVWTDTTSTCTIDGALQATLHKMRRELQMYSKCFSGKQLTDWIMANPGPFCNMWEEVSAEDISKKRTNCVAVAQWLMDQGLLVDIETELFGQFEGSMNHAPDLCSSDEPLDLNYPALSIHSSMPTSGHVSDISSPDDTPTGSPSGRAAMNFTPALGRLTRSRDSTPVPRSRPQSHLLSQSRSRKGTPLPRFANLSVYDDQMNFLSLTEDDPNDISRYGLGVSNPGDDSLLSDNYDYGESSAGMFSPRLDSMLASRLFQDGTNHFYHITSLMDSSIHPQTQSRSPNVPSELNTLVEQCFQRKIVPDYIITILYSRRKYDYVAKMFSQRTLQDPDCDLVIGRSDSTCVTS